MIVTSDACCVGVEDFKVVAVGTSGERLILAEYDEVLFKDIFKSKLPEIDDSFSSIMVSCIFHSDKKYKIEETILSNEDIEEVKKRGLLINVDENVGLNIRVGNREISYERNRENGKWEQLDAPRKLYK